MDGIRELGVIFQGELSRALKSGRAVVLLLLFLMFTGLMLTVFGYVSYQINQTSMKQINEEIDASPYKDDLDPKLVQERREKASREIEDQKKKAVGWLFASDDTALAEALKKLPLVLLVVFKLTTIFLPLFIALMGFDQISGEIGPRSIRYLVVRARRSSIVLGKFAAQAGLLALLTFVCVLAMSIVGKLVDTEFTLGAMALTVLRFWVTALMFSLAYLGLTSLCSSLFRTPAVSLVINLIALFGIWFVGAVGDWYRLPGEASDNFSISSLKPESSVGYVRYVSVWHYAGDLLHPAFSKVAVASLAHLGFAVFFLGLSYLVLRSRDV